MHRKITSLLAILTIAISAFAQTASFRWVLTQDMAEEWAEGKSLSATTITTSLDHSLCSGTLSAQIQGGGLMENVGKLVSINGMGEGDAFLFTMKLPKAIEAGSLIDCYFTLNGKVGSHRDFAIEYFDGACWQRSGEVFSLNYGSEEKDKQLRTVAVNFSLSSDLSDTYLKIRIKAVGDARVEDSSGKTAAQEGVRHPVSLNKHGYVAAQVDVYTPKDLANVVDCSKVLFIGNSFTFYYGSVMMLKEIAMSMGHKIDATMNFKGGQTFGQHLALSQSREAIARGGYNVVILQNQSNAAADVVNNRNDSAEGILSDAAEIASLVRSSSPGCKIVNEWDWGYGARGYGYCGDMTSFEAALEKGNALISKKMKADKTSPIGPAFKYVRNNNPEINLYSSDRLHQSEEGSYLKSCVNFLLLYPDTAADTFLEGASSCSIDPAVARMLREAALLQFGK